MSTDDPRQVPLRQAYRDLGKITKAARYQRRSTIITEHGEPAAMVLPAPRTLAGQRALAEQAARAAGSEFTQRAASPEPPASPVMRTLEGHTQEEKAEVLRDLAGHRVTIEAGGTEHDGLLSEGDGIFLVEGEDGDTTLQPNDDIRVVTDHGPAEAG